MCSPQFQIKKRNDYFIETCYFVRVRMSLFLWKFRFWVKKKVILLHVFLKQELVSFYKICGCFRFALWAKKQHLKFERDSSTIYLLVLADWKYREWVCVICWVVLKIYFRHIATWQHELNIKVLKVLLAGLICRYIMVGRRGSRFLG